MKRRRLAGLLAIALAMPLGPSVLAYVCTVDAQVHRSCCCAQRGPCPSPHVAGSCCDVVTSSPERAIRATHAPEFVPVFAPVVGIRPWSVAGRSRTVAPGREVPAAHDPPIFKSKRVYLI